MLRKTLVRAGLGFLIGMFVGNLIAVLTGGISPDSFIPLTPQISGIAQGNMGVAFALQTFFSGLYGAVCFAGMFSGEIAANNVGQRKADTGDQEDYPLINIGLQNKIKNTDD